MNMTNSTDVVCFGEARLLARCLTGHGGHGSVHRRSLTTVLTKRLSDSETAAPLMRANVFLSQYIFLCWKNLTCC